MTITVLFGTEAQSRPLVPSQFEGLARACAPNVTIDAVRAIAGKESHFDPLALHNNSRKVTTYAKDTLSAVLLARTWMNAGDSVDLGLMQIHTSNLTRLGLTLERAFDPCASLAAGAAILRAAYDKGSTPAEREAALLIAYSRYNTGKALDGVINGYASDVMSRASQDKGQGRPTEVRPIARASASWDVWGAVAPSDPQQAWFVDYSPSRRAVLLAGTISPSQPTTAGD
jgi:type IV secretion system protein VirB1